MKKFGRKFGFSFNPRFFPVLVTVIGIVMVWRGVWFLLDLYLFPNHPELSGLTSLLIGLTILYLPNGKIDHLI